MTRKLQERIAKLTGGTAVIYVGQHQSRNERKSAVEDALNSVRALFRNSAGRCSEEQVCGWYSPRWWNGTASFSNKTRRLLADSELDMDILTGVKIVEAIQEPIRAIAKMRA